MKTIDQYRDELAYNSVSEYLKAIYPILEKAQIIYSEDQLEHCSEDNFKAGFNAAHTPEVLALLPAEALLAHPAVADAVRALTKYADGSAFDFNRGIRGEVNFDGGLSSATAREVLKPFTPPSEGR